MARHTRIRSRTGKTLCEASLAARELALVDADRFVDRRAGEPTYIFIPDDEASEAEVNVIDDAIERPSPEEVPRYTPRDYTFPPLPDLTVFAPEIVEHYAVEIWCEKSTMNDVLEPLGAPSRPDARRRSRRTVAHPLQHAGQPRPRTPTQDPHPLYRRLRSGRRRHAGLASPAR